jgi:predicted ATP-dependent serine protease
VHSFHIAESEPEEKPESEKASMVTSPAGAGATPRRETTMADNEITSNEQFDIEIEELDTVNGAGVSVSSLACAACPVSSFSSVSNAATELTE